MDTIISPVLLYLLLALGAVGVCVAMPRRTPGPRGMGGLLAASAAGLVILLLTIAAGRAGEGLPNIFFYVLGIIALGSSLRVVTHPRPVYAALYLILTILASAGLYLVLSAEFMALALIIIYAGAILITYLFVIMLATQAPTAEQVEALPEYDAASREPIAATVAGFALLAVLTTMMFSGVRGLPGPSDIRDSDRVLAEFPKRIERALREEKLIESDERLARDPETGRLLVDADARTVQVASGEAGVRTVSWPADLRLSNVEGVGHNLLVEHPGSIEIAGVILLMAMLGAVVLARQRVQMEEEAKAQAARGGTP